jgi:protein TonB
MIAAGLLLALIAAQAPVETAPEPAPPTVRARAELSFTISDDDYPPAALAARAQGWVGFRLAISPEGRVTDCTIVASSGSAALDAQTCRLYQSRASFRPARDAVGRATGDVITGRIHWQLPGG